MTKLTKIIYFVLFLLLLLHPHFITGHIYSIPEAYAQSLVTMAILVFAYGIYFLHKRDIKKREREKDIIKKELNTSNNKLLDAFKYIGHVNLRLPLLKTLTTDLLKRDISNKKEKKNIFNELLALSVTSIIKVDWGVFRFIDIISGNTIKEIVHTEEKDVLFQKKISNQQLLKTRSQGIQINEVGDFCVIPASGQNSAIQCFLVFPKAKTGLDDESSTLQSIVDQAQLFYKYFY